MNEIEKQRSSIRRAMEYAVAADDLPAAEDLLLQYREDRIALDVLLEFYSYLPEAREDYIRDIRLVARSHGIFLLAAITGLSAYLYLISGEGVEFHGTLDQGYLDRDLLRFFGYENLEEFRRQCEQKDELPPYEPLQLDTEVCPACHAVTGELHELGCPVEVCPWCGGQLIGCSCRFEQLGVDEIVSEEDILRLEALLEERGRIAYSPDQRPGFIDDGPGIYID